MAEQVEEVVTISKAVDEQSKREKKLSLPTKHVKKSVGLRHTQSQNYGHQLRPHHVPPTIPEIDITESETIEMRSRSNSNRSHRSNTSRKSQGKKQLELSPNGYENGFYDGPLPDSDRLSKHSLDSRSNISGSTQSLQIQREQYCCSPQWTPCERKLVATVGVLATIIVILVVVVGYMAGKGDSSDTKFRWSF